MAAIALPQGGSGIGFARGWILAASPPPPPPPPGPPPFAGPGAGNYLPPPPPGSAPSDQAPNGTLILVLGIVGVLEPFVGAACCGCLGLVMTAPGWVAFFMGREALKQYPTCGLSKAGTILGIITMVLTALGAIAMIALLALYGTMFGLGMAQGMSPGSPPTPFGP